MILNDMQIKDLVQKNEMIDPFIHTQIKEVNNKRVISYGLSSFGYDLRLGTEFYSIKKNQRLVINPFSDQKLIWEKVIAKNEMIIPPNSVVLGHSKEYLRIPRNILGVVHGKSTYARCGIIVNVTPLEPEWEGYLTIELSNTTPYPALIFPNQGVAQLMFFRNNFGCEVSYADRKGKYQNQIGTTLAKV